jgi:hypothetical protein
VRCLALFRAAALKHILPHCSRGPAGVLGLWLELPFLLFPIRFASPTSPLRPASIAPHRSPSARTSPLPPALLPSLLPSTMTQTFQCVYPCVAIITHTVKTWEQNFITTRRLNRTHPPPRTPYLHRRIAQGARATASSVFHNAALRVGRRATSGSRYSAWSTPSASLRHLSAGIPKPPALNSRPWALNPQPSTLNPQP